MLYVWRDARILRLLERSRASSGPVMSGTEVDPENGESYPGVDCVNSKVLPIPLAFIGLGSNVGDRLQFLQRAVRDLGATVGIQVIDVSSVYETEPVGPAGQPWFLNAVAAVDTTLSPL